MSGRTKSRFAIVGAGVISARHAEALAAFAGQAELVAVVDPDSARTGRPVRLDT